MQESRFPSKEKYPAAPAYAPRRVGSPSAKICKARTLGDPLTVPAGNVARMTW